MDLNLLSVLVTSSSSLQLFPVALLALCLFLKGRRLSFVLPSMLLAVVVLFPPLYRLWDLLGLYAQWRIFWLIPVIPVFAAVPAAVCGRLRSPVLCLAVAGLCLAACVFGGNFVYSFSADGLSGSSSGGTFALPAPNACKLPQEAELVARWLLAEEEHPRVVSDPNLCEYLRQYSGDIDQLFGRDANGYIYSAASDEAMAAYWALIDPDRDLSTVVTVMLNNDYRYLIADNREAQRRADLAGAGFELVTQIGDYGVYTAHGLPTLRKEKNSLSQVISVTTLDESGSPVNGEAGYATVSYRYDSNGNTVRVFRTDTEGNGVADGSGSAGWERECDARGQILMERQLGPDGEPMINSLGYVEVRREYRGKKLLREAYFDAVGQPVNRADLSYAAVSYKRDSAGHAVEEHYFDIQGEPVLSSAGYASVVRRYDGGRIAREDYYGTDGIPVTLPGGYASVARSYDQRGHLTLEAWYDAAGNPALMPGGYVAVAQTYGEDGSLLSRRYLGPDGEPVLRSDGFAEVRLEEADGAESRNLTLYDLNGDPVSLESVNLVTGLQGDGWSAWMTPRRNVTNSTFTVASANLGQKAVGDSFTCRIEIEFSGVTASGGRTFGFRTQGAADGAWGIGNVWNSSLIKLSEAPADGVYQFTATATINEDMASVSTFSIGFRCDYWASGSFRIRSVKVERGEAASPWSPGW